MDPWVIYGIIVIVGCLIAIVVLAHNNRKKNLSDGYSVFSIPNGKGYLKYGENIIINNGYPGDIVSTPDKYVSNKLIFTYTEMANKISTTRYYKSDRIKLKPFLPKLLHGLNKTQTGQLKVKPKKVIILHTEDNIGSLIDSKFDVKELEMITRMNLSMLLTCLFADKKKLMFEYPDDLPRDDTNIKRLRSIRQQAINILNEELDLLSMSNFSFREKKINGWGQLMDFNCGIDKWTEKSDGPLTMASIVLGDLELDGSIEGRNNTYRATIGYKTDDMDFTGYVTKVTGLTVDTVLTKVNNRKVVVETILICKNKNFQLGIAIPMEFKQA